MPGPQEQLTRLLHEVNRELNRFHKETMSTYGLTPPALMICGQVNSEPGVTISEIARRTGIAKSHVSNLVRCLEQRGWIGKQPDSKDQRVQRLYLNESGQKQLHLVKAAIRARLDQLAADIPEEQAAALIKGLMGLKAVLNRARERE